MEINVNRAELETKIGSFFMAGIPGTTLDAETDSLIQQYVLGGVILFSRNIVDPQQLAVLCNDLQDSAMKSHGIPLFIAVDQEGGRVARLREPFTSFPGNTAIGEDPQSVDRAAEFARVTAEEMSLVGLNMDLAPVVDVLRGEPEKHLEGRTFGHDPGKVALLGRTVVTELQKKGVMATAKHFPGLGRTTLDPHHQLPTIDADYKEIEQVNLPPFVEAIAAGVSAIMSSHAIYPALDPDHPATLSHKILTGLLRETMGFNGLIITDDLEMGAIKKGWGVADGAVASFEAGADILLICQDQKMVLGAFNMLREKVIKGEIGLHRLQQSLDRIMKAKSEFLKKREQASLEKVRAYFGL
jgi:beta-N-acetylhexosaminidase